MLVELEWVDHHRIYEQFTFGISSHSNGKVLPSQVEDGTTHVKTYYKVQTYNYSPSIWLSLFPFALGRVTLFYQTHLFSCVV